MNISPDGDYRYPQSPLRSLAQDRLFKYGLSAFPAGAGFHMPRTQAKYLNTFNSNSKLFNAFTCWR